MRPLELDVSRLKVTPTGAEPLVWPVARAELARARYETLSGFCSIVAREVATGGEARVLSIAPFYFAAEVVGLLEARLLLDRCSAAGFSPVVPDGWRFLSALSEGRTPSLTASPMLVQLRRGPSRTAPWRRRLRPLRNLRYPSDAARRPLSRIDLDRDVVITTTGPLLDAHRLAVQERFVFVDYSEWFTVPPGRSDPSMHPAIAEAVAVAEAAFKTAGARFTGDLAEHLRAWLEAALALSSGYADQIARPATRIPTKMWIGTAGSIWARLLFHEVDARGGHVTAHDHGTGSGFRDNPEKTINDLSGCHTFVTFTEQHAIDTRSQITPELLMVPTPPEVTWVRDPAAAQRIVSPRRRPVRTIMVLTNFFRGDRNHHASVLPDPVTLDLQARLFDRLRGWGYEVLHKPHPESKAHPPASLYSFGAQRVDGYFEDVLDRVDAVILLWDSPSTVLRVALATELPIVVVDIQQGSWRQHALDLLKRRCAVVRGDFDEQNRVVLDWAALKRAIDESTELNDDGFLKTYFGG
jgi:hypothetical protein